MCKEIKSLQIHTHPFPLSLTPHTHLYLPTCLSNYILEWKKSKVLRFQSFRTKSIVLKFVLSLVMSDGFTLLEKHLSSKMLFSKLASSNCVPHFFFFFFTKTFGTEMSLYGYILIFTVCNGSFLDCIVLPTLQALITLIDTNKSLYLGDCIFSFLLPHFYLWQTSVQRR